MDPMNNLNNLLNEKVMIETLHGGPAHHRQAHLRTDPDARWKAELRAEKADAQRQHRMLTLRLPGVWTVSVRLPRWVPVGRLTA
jgi:hypothetical protein